MGHLLPGFLSCNKFTVPLQRSYDPATHLSYSDITVDDYDNPSLIVIYIRNLRWTLSVRDQHYTGCNPGWNLPSESSNTLLTKMGFTSRRLCICENQLFLTQQTFRSHFTKLLQNLNLTLPVTLYTASELGQPHQQRLQDWQNQNQNPWQMEKQCLPLLHQANALPASHIFNTTSFSGTTK